LSGGDECSLLLRYFTKTKEGSRVYQQINKVLWKPMEQTMVAIKHQVETAENPRKRKRWISLVSDFDCETLKKRFKFDITSKQLTAAKKYVFSFLHFT